MINESVEVDQLRQQQLAQLTLTMPPFRDPPFHSNLNFKWQPLINFLGRIP